MLPSTLLVVDSCALEDPGLSDYLRASPDRGIILDRLTLFEMFKVNPVKTSRKSLRILSEFPEQVHVLHPSHRWLNGVIDNEEQLQQLIDPEITAELRNLCAAIGQDPLPDWVEPLLLKRQSEAEDYIVKLTDEVSDMESILLERSQLFSPQQITEIRTGEHVSDETRQKVHKLLHDVTGQFILAYQEPGRTEPLQMAVAMNMFAFRYALCIVMFYLDWVKHGKTTKRLDRRVNDVIDLQVAAVSTFFNGVMSNDARMRTVAVEAARQLMLWKAYIRELKEDAHGQGDASRSNHS